LHQVPVESMNLSVQTAYGFPLARSATQPEPRYNSMQDGTHSIVDTKYIELQFEHVNEVVTALTM